MQAYAIKGTNLLISESERGTGALSLTTTVLEEPAQLVAVGVTFGVAPTTSENLTVVRKSRLHADYDLTLLTTNPSTTSATDILYQPDSPFWLLPGDTVTVAFTNTDVRQYAVEVILQRGV